MLNVVKPNEKPLAKGVVVPIRQGPSMMDHARALGGFMGFCAPREKDNRRVMSEKELEDACKRWQEQGELDDSFDSRALLC
jgi:hypothetical protein